MTDAGWTREKPKVAGWYWWRFRDGKDPVAMKIGDDHIAKTNLFTMGTSVLLIDELPGEWLGPISPDTYHQGRVAGELFGLQQGLLIAYIFESGTAKQVIEGIKSRIAEIEQRAQGGAT